MTNTVFNYYPCLLPCRREIEEVEDVLIACFLAGRKLLLCGNGGSAADCEHIVGELMKGFMKRRKPDSELTHRLTAIAGEERANFLTNHLQGALPAISLTVENALTAAFCNDVAAETVFAQGVMGYGNPGDVLLCISTSGNSENCVAAAEVAKAKGLTVLALTGAKESKLSALADVTVRVPETETYRVQELHLPVYHAVCADVEAAFFKE